LKRESGGFVSARETDRRFLCAGAYRRWNIAVLPHRKKKDKTEYLRKGISAANRNFEKYKNLKKGLAFFLKI